MRHLIDQSGHGVGRQRLERRRPRARDRQAVSSLARWAARSAQARSDRKSAGSRPSRRGRSAQGQAVLVELRRRHQWHAAVASRRHVGVPVKSASAGDCPAGAGHRTPFRGRLSACSFGLACGPTTDRLAASKGVGCAHPRQRFARRPESWPGCARPQENGHSPESARLRRVGVPGGAVRRFAPHVCRT